MSQKSAGSWTRCTHSNAFPGFYKHSLAFHSELGRFTSIACHQVSFKCGSVRPKFGFGIRNQNQGPISVLVSEPNFAYNLPWIFYWHPPHPSSVARLTFLPGLKALIYSSIKSSFQTLDNRYNIKRLATPLIYLTILFGSILKVKCKDFLSILRL